MGSVAVITVGSILYLSLFRERKDYSERSIKPTKSKSRQIQSKPKAEKPASVDESTPASGIEDKVVAQVEQSQKELTTDEKENGKENIVEKTVESAVTENKTSETESSEVVVEKEETIVVESKSTSVETTEATVLESTVEVAHDVKEQAEAVVEIVQKNIGEDKTVEEVVSAIVSEVQDTVPQAVADEEEESVSETDAEWSAILPSEHTSDKETEKEPSTSNTSPAAEAKAASPAPSQTSSSSSSTENGLSLTPGHRTPPTKSKNQSAIRTPPYATASNNNNNAGYYWGQPSQYKSDWAQLFTLPQQQADLNSHSYYSRSIPSLPSTVDVLPEEQYDYASNKKKRMSRPEQIEQQRQAYIPPMKSRCIYWPSCTNKNCKFAHPTKQCREGDNCTYGERCMFLHVQDMEQPTRPARSPPRRPRSRTAEN
ncbi:hypothetical protein DFQ28_005239 [Apophysomyces sp. BC1034]|nr:hypothetical protein DFQ30_007949 [Apophysomyces sp. BC1015]KAG0176601.1 hypothetical protein DFQ29_005930 [Apophysomyces sp. BC1021]KAG0188203.1 hypothetical protein DFQ28_005239 [Apophysomyces sp. BC1034]